MLQQMLGAQLIPTDNLGTAKSSTVLPTWSCQSTLPLKLCSCPLWRHSPPTKASPAPLVSTIFSGSMCMTGYSVTWPSVTQIRQRLDQRMDKRSCTFFLVIGWAMKEMFVRSEGIQTRQEKKAERTDQKYTSPCNTWKFWGHNYFWHQMLQYLG